MRYSASIDEMLRAKYENDLQKAREYDKIKKKEKEKAILVNTISNKLEDRISPISSHINIMQNDIIDLQNAISMLDTKINIIENAADRCEIPKRPRRKLTIKVSA